MRPRSLPIVLPAGELLEVALTGARPHNVMPRLGAQTDNRATCRIPRWTHPPLHNQMGGRAGSIGQCVVASGSRPRMESMPGSVRGHRDPPAWRRAAGDGDGRREWPSGPALGDRWRTGRACPRDHGTCDMGRSVRVIVRPRSGYWAAIPGASLRFVRNDPMRVPTAHGETLGGCPSGHS